MADATEDGGGSADSQPIAPRARGLARLVDVRPGEGLTLVLSALYFFTLLAGYFVLRPVREAMGIKGGAENLPVLFSFTMIGMILVNPVFAWLVTRVRRRVFVPTVYVATIAVLLAFRLAYELFPRHDLYVGYTYYVAVSVINLFVVSVFWAFMADIWRLEQAKRLYGCIGAGGTIGAIAGAQVVTWLATRIGSENMLFVSAGFFALSLVFIAALMRLHRVDTPAERNIDTDLRPDPATSGPPQRSDIWRGMRLVATTPYLRWIAAFVFMHGLMGTFLYFQQANLVAREIPDDDERTRLFAVIDTFAQAATLLVQLFLTGRLMRRFGIGFALLTQPVVAIAGWSALSAALWLAPSTAAAGATIAGLSIELAVLIGAQVLLRTSNHATVRPAREALFTVVSREVKYKSKSFIDTFVFRLADAGTAWVFRWLSALGLGLPVLATISVPLGAVWFAIGRGLGRRQRELVAEVPATETSPSQTSASKSAETV